MFTEDDDGSRVTAAPILPMALYRFNLAFDDDAQLPPYPGSALRGVFGIALKNAVCVTHQPTCTGCLLRACCPYSYIFETPPPPATQKMRRYDAAPHPFVLQLLQLEVSPDRSFPLAMAVFGRANNLLPYLIYAWQSAGQRGVGGTRTTFQLTSVAQWDEQTSDWREIYRQGGSVVSAPPRAELPPAKPSRVKITLNTPLRLQREGRFVQPAQFELSDLTLNVVRRISMLTYFHTDTPLDADFLGLKQAAQSTNIDDRQLRWHDWARYSSRQQTTMEMGGLLGSFSISTNGLEALWPYLWLGQKTHAGKATSMGLGAYHIDASE